MIVQLIIRPGSYLSFDLSAICAMEHEQEDYWDGNRYRKRKMMTGSHAKRIFKTIVRYGEESTFPSIADYLKKHSKSYHTLFISECERVGARYE